jgi:drug/metabolite transporter (DMT)-like permease
LSTNEATPLTHPAVNHELIGSGMVAIGALAFSSLILFTRVIEGMDALAIAFFRAFFAFLFFCVLLIRFRAPLNFLAYRRELPRLLLLGGLTGVTAALYIYAIQKTSAANAALLVNSAPVYIALIAPFWLREKRPRFTWLSLFSVLLGIGLITSGSGENGSGGNFLGILAGVLSGFLYAWVLMISRFLGNQVGGYTQAFWGAGIAALVLAPWAIGVSWQVVSPSLIYLIPAGIISLGLSTLLYYLALQRVRAQVASVVAILEPVFGALIGVFLFGEQFTGSGLAGCLFVLTGIFLITRR